MPRAVKFNNYGGIEVLQVVDVDRPKPGTGKVLVRVKAAGINPGEASFRKGFFAERWPATFPSGLGSDLAGIVEEVGPGVANVAVGDEVIGFTNDRASQADFVLVESGNLVPRPRNVSWEQAGALFVAGTTAYAAVRSVGLSAGDTVVVSAAAKYGVKTEGNWEAANAVVLGQLAGLIAAGRLEIPIAKVYPLAQVRDAYRDLEQRHTRGKIVLEP